MGPELLASVPLDVPIFLHRSSASHSNAAQLLDPHSSLTSSPIPLFVKPSLLCVITVVCFL